MKLLVPEFSLPRSCGSDEQWSALLRALNSAESLDVVFKKYKLHDKLENKWNEFAHGSAFVNWLYFISLQLNTDKLTNSYLVYVLKKTISFESFTRNILDAIKEVKHTDGQFDNFYVERKKLLEKYSEPEMAEYVNRNRKNQAESIIT
jgi:hypothetical protein